MSAVASLAADGIVVLTLLVLVHATWVDFNTLRISNKTVLSLLGLYAIWALLTKFESFAGDLATGIILFLTAFCLWLIRLMGAGDVKLYFALGLFMGFTHLGVFAVLLLLVSVLFLLLLKAAQASKSDAPAIKQLRYFNTEGKAAYAVVMNCAAIPVIALRLFS